MTRFAQAALLLIALAWGTSATGDPLDDARRAVDECAVQLQAALGGALRDGGPVAAVEVCAEQAPVIAARVSDEHNLRVGRVGTRLRNPRSAPTPWSLRALKDFQRRANAGEPIASMEWTELDGRSPVRYARAIPVGGVCLTCHGERLAPAVEAAIRSHYPNDDATNYQPGDLRGAFVAEGLAP